MERTIAASTSHMQSCLNIDLGLIKLSNVEILSKSLFGDYLEMGHIWTRISAIDQVFTVQTCR